MKFDLNQNHVLVIGYVWPERLSSAAGLRDWNLVETFLNAKWKVTYASPSRENFFSEELNHLGIKTVTIKANDPSFDEFIKQLIPDFVIFDRFVIEEQFGWRVREHCPKSVRILDTQDLHFLRKGRELALKHGASLSEIKNCEFNLISEDTLREIAAIYRSDFTLILSDFEIRLLIDQFHIPEEFLLLSRFHYEDPPVSISGFNERRHFAMIGNFRHPPNVDGVLWFKNEIWNLIRSQLPAAQIHIYGAYPPKQMMKLTEIEAGFYVKGPIKDQFSTLAQYRVNVAPLRFGAGIKGKITDGWWVGTPVITTPVGAEGMHDTLPWGGTIAEDPVSFAEAAIRLYSDEAEWKSSQTRGLNLIRHLYSKKIHCRIIIEQMLKIKTTIEARRLKNITGAMLNYHLHKSTKYFSKWIEEKNKFPILNK